MGGAAGVAFSALAAHPAPAYPATPLRTPPPARTDALLGRVCRLVRDVLPVSRATVLVFEEPGALVPAVSVAWEDHDELWQRFRAMRPIRLDVSPATAALLRDDRVVVVDDAATSPLVPGEWRDAFGLTSLAVAPLHVDGRPWGALVVDDGAARHEFSAHEVRTLGDLAALAAVAIAAVEDGAGVEAERDLRTALRHAVARLRDTSDLSEAVDAVAPALLDATGYELLAAAVRDARLARSLHVPRTTAYEPETQRLLRAGEAVTSDGRLLVPLRGAGGLLGVLVLRSHGGRARRLDLVFEAAESFAAVVDRVGVAQRAATAAAGADHTTARLAYAREAIDNTLRTFRGAGYARARSGQALFSVATSGEARRAIDELDEARQVFAALSTHPSLTGALRSLLEGGAGSQHELHWAPTGAAPRYIAPESEIAVLRTAARFLGLVREARGRVLGARLSFVQDGIECHLSSNGVLRDQGGFPAGAENPVSGPWLEEVGGHVDFESGASLFSVRFSVPYDPSDRVSVERRQAPRVRTR